MNTTNPFKPKIDPAGNLPVEYHNHQSVAEPRFEKTAAGYDLVYNLTTIRTGVDADTGLIVSVEHVGDQSIRYAAPTIKAAKAELQRVRPLKPVTNNREKIGRNDPCPCGSGKKWKHCHLPVANAGKTGPIKSNES